MYISTRTAFIHSLKSRRGIPTIAAWFLTLLLVILLSASHTYSEPFSYGLSADARTSFFHYGPPICHDGDKEIPDTIPTGEAWMAHFLDDILPYWTVEAALGQPVGNFPTFRCNDGSVYDADNNPCPELHNTADWITSNFGREFVRMKSRQTYFYGVAYHLTGDEEMFRFHQAGVKYLRENALDPEGGAYTYFDGNEWGPPTEERTSQDLSYAALGLAMNYYLTRDPSVRADIEKLKDYIFTEYWDDSIGMIKWTRDNPNNEQELVAQLDQLNAYMLILSPMLPKKTKYTWDRDIKRLVRVLYTKFYNSEYKLFWGAITTPEQQTVGSFHTDFGHTIKTLWMIHTAGKLFHKKRWVHFAVRNANITFARAYITEDTPFGDAGNTTFDRQAYLGAWSEKLTGQETDNNFQSVWPGTEWWSYTELDQMAATLAIDNNMYLHYLKTTYPKWFERMVDESNGGIWHKLTNKDTVEFAKAHLWKNGYHEAEHTLMGYITSQELRDKDVKLYFAFHNNADNQIKRPYYFEGDVEKVKMIPFNNYPDYRRVRVTFDNIDQSLFAPTRGAPSKGPHFLANWPDERV